MGTWRPVVDEEQTVCPSVPVARGNSQAFLVGIIFNCRSTIAQVLQLQTHSTETFASGVVSSLEDKNIRRVWNPLRTRGIFC